MGPAEGGRGACSGGAPRPGRPDARQGLAAAIAPWAGRAAAGTAHWVRGATRGEDWRAARGASCGGCGGPGWVAGRDRACAGVWGGLLLAAHTSVVQLPPAGSSRFSLFQERSQRLLSGWDEHGGGRWGGGYLAKLQGTAPYKESRQQIRAFRSGSGGRGVAESPIRTRQAPAGACGGGKRRVLVF